jgi:hypothetical protein
MLHGSSDAGLALTVHVAKAAGFALLGVVEATRPVDGNIAFLSIEPSSTFHATTSTNTTELEEAIEDGTVIANIELCLFSLIALHVLRANFLQEVDVLVGVELSHLESGCGLRSVDLHLLINAVVHDQTVGETYSVRFHRMAGDIGEVANVGVVEVGDLLGRGGAKRNAIAIGNVDRGGMRHGL